MTNRTPGVWRAHGSYLAPEYAHAMRAEEGDLSFADFAGRSEQSDGPGLPYTAPTDLAIPGQIEDPEGSSGENVRDSEDFPADWMVAQARIELATPAFSVARKRKK